MSHGQKVLTVEIRTEHDVVLTRQRARQLAALLGFEAQDQTRIATAVSEIARNAFEYVGAGTVDFFVKAEPPQVFVIRLHDHGRGIADVSSVLDGRYRSTTGMGLGILGARKLMDQFEIETSPEKGTDIVMGKRLPPKAKIFSVQRLAGLATELLKQSPVSPLDELHQQNQELLQALAALRTRETELQQTNRMLEDTNRGVMALYVELDEKAESLSRANQTKTRFLSNMTHEFRTPLNSILSLSRILLDRLDGELTVEQAKQATYIQKAAGDLSELVNDLLDLAKVEAGKSIVRPSPFYVAELFGALRGMLRPLLSDNPSVTLVVVDPEQIPMLETDHSKVGQILRNFVSNAIKYTEKGEIRVSATTGPGDTVIFAVADSGIGIASEDQERIFEEYVQIESPIQDRVKGTGLGLPLSRKLAGLLGGSVSVEGQLGVGCTFRLILPRQYRGPVEEVLPNGIKRREKILIVDDDEVARYLLKGLLSGLPYDILEAAGGREGLSRVREQKPSAVFLDLGMPDLSGFEVLQQIKSDPLTREIPVIVSTARELDENEHRILAPLVVEVLSKQAVGRQVAMARVRSALENAGLAWVARAQEMAHA